MKRDQQAAYDGEDLAARWGRLRRLQAELAAAAEDEARLRGELSAAVKRRRECRLALDGFLEAELRPLPLFDRPPPRPAAPEGMGSNHTLEPAASVPVSADFAKEVAASIAAAYADVSGTNVASPRHCRVCGCTDAVGCPEGCEWAGEDLCSECQGYELVGHVEVREGASFALYRRGDDCVGSADVRAFGDWAHEQDVEEGGASPHDYWPTVREIEEAAARVSGGRLVYDDYEIRPESGRLKLTFRLPPAPRAGPSEEQLRSTMLRGLAGLPDHAAEVLAGAKVVTVGDLLGRARRKKYCADDPSRHPERWAYAAARGVPGVHADCARVVASAVAHLWAAPGTPPPEPWEAMRLGELMQPRLHGPLFSAGLVTVGDLARRLARGETLAGVKRLSPAMAAEALALIASWWREGVGGDLPAWLPAPAPPPPPKAPAPPKHYAWDVIYTRNDRPADDPEVVTLVARSEAEARRKALLRPNAREVISVSGMTEEQYRRAHGSRRRRV